MVVLRSRVGLGVAIVLQVVSAFVCKPKVQGSKLKAVFFNPRFFTQDFLKFVLKVIGFKGTVSYGFYQSLFLNEVLNIFIINAILLSTIWYSNRSSFSKGARLNTRCSGFESQRSLIFTQYIFLNSSGK